MTVLTTANKVSYIGDNATLTFSFPFAMPQGGQSDISAYITDSSGNITTLAQGTQYTVIINPTVSPNPTPVGGSISLTSTVPLGSTLTILRTLLETQPTSLANQGALWQPVIEAALDDLTMQIQQLQELLGRQIAVAVSDPAPNPLPPVAQRANLIMGFDASGNPSAVAAAPSGVISSAMAPFVGSSTLAAAKALLGYGTMANENIGAAGKGIADDGSGNARVSQTVLAVATNQSPGLAQHQTNYVSSGTRSHTLPQLSTVFNGYELWFFCISGTATISPNAADTFPGLGGGVGITLQTGYFARVIGDGSSSWQIARGRIPSINVTGLSYTVLSTPGPGTYTIKAGCNYIKVRMIGGGGGGSGSVSSGSTGGDSIFNSIHAAGGGGGASAQNGVGGSNGTGVATLRIPGGNGNTSGGLVAIGGIGVFGGNGFNTSTGFTTPPGSGGYGSIGGSQPGGGAGEYAELVINSPLSATYAYTVGAAGAAGTGGSVQAGGPGQIIIEEYF